MKFNEHLKQLRKDHNLSQNDLANQFGYKSFTTIQKWEDGTAMPPMKVLNALADFFQLSVDELINGKTYVEIPILGLVRGGPNQIAQEDYLGHERVSMEEARGGTYFYLEVVGDSMINARMFPKDLIYVKRQNHVENGEIAVGLFNKTSIVKKISLNWTDLNITGKHSIRNVWSQTDIGDSDKNYETQVLPHGVVLVKILKNQK